MTPLRARGAQAVADAWNTSVPNKYRIDAALVRQNLLDHPLFHEEASLWGEDAFVAVKRSASGLYQGPNPKVAHLALLGGGDVSENRGQMLRPPLLAATEVLRRDGYEALVIGQDSGHFLPGAPTDVPWLSWFLKAQGFERGDLAFDLQRDVREVKLSPEGYDERIALRKLTESDTDSLLSFLDREFPGRWRYDIGRKLAAEGPSSVFGLIVEGEVEGFALLQEEDCRLPIGGAVWKDDLGERWGSLGPIGVARELRGRSYGIELLNAALVELQRRGARTTIIDWTGLIDFYGTQGFSVARTYRSYRLSLQAGP